MSKFLTLLTSLLFLGVCYGQDYETDQKTPITNISGFVTTTVFSNNQWFDNSANIAVNIDTTLDNWAVRAQLGGPFVSPVRRAVVEYAKSVGSNKEMIVQAGLFPRLSSFYNNVNDAPGSTEIAMLPLGEYNRRLLSNNTFSSLIGTSATYKYFTDTSMLALRADIGKAAVEDNCAVETEFTLSACKGGYVHQSRDDNYDISVNYEIGKVEFLAALNVFRMKTQLTDPTNLSGRAVSSTFAVSNLKNETIGIKYTDSKWWVQTELTRITILNDDINGNPVHPSTERNIYALFGYRIADRWSVHIYGSDGLVYDGRFTGYRSKDTAVGVTYSNGKSRVTLEYHDGYALKWKKPLAPINSWNSFVCSYTWQW